MHPEANIIFGSTFDQTMKDRLRVSVIITGLSKPKLAPVAPNLSAAALRTPATQSFTPPTAYEVRLHTARSCARPFFLCDDVAPVHSTLHPAPAPYRLSSPSPPSPVPVAPSTATVHGTVAASLAQGQQQFSVATTGVLQQQLRDWDQRWRGRGLERRRRQQRAFELVV